MAGQKILYIFDANDAASRLPVAQKAKEEGFTVIIGLIGNPADSKAFRGFETLQIPVPAGRLRPPQLAKLVKDLAAILKQTRPDIIHAVTLKYAFITGLAARPFPAMRKIYTLAGLGYLFRSSDPKSYMLRALVAPLLKYIFKKPRTTLIFQNEDDRQLLVKMKYAEEKNTVLIRGSGVDLKKFTPRVENSELLVLMPTRLVREKGVQVFIDAAKILQGTSARFAIAGGETVHNPKAISRSEMEAMIKGSNVEWLGRVEDMPALLASAALIVYPSYYGEGIPRVLLEACAAGRAIVTTDNPGCREAVKDGYNGLLVPVKDPKATAEAISRLLGDAGLRHQMSKNSRALAEQEFDINIIATKTADVYKT
jgi:glycosyltransferase involved in cell wall biosynthesis